MKYQIKRIHGNIGNKWTSCTVDYVQDITFGRPEWYSIDPAVVVFVYADKRKDRVHPLILRDRLESEIASDVLKYNRREHLCEHDRGIRLRA